MIQQISAFLENKAGELSKITKVLTTNDVNIRAINIAEAKEYGVIRFIVDDYQKAADALVDAGVVVSTTKVAAVKVPNVPGGLNLVLEVIAREKIDIEYMYSMLKKDHSQAYMVFKVADVDRFNEIMVKSGLNIAEEIDS